MCLLVGLAFFCPWLSLVICGKVPQGIISLVAQIIGGSMICLVFIPFVGWLIALIGLMIFIGNVAFAITTITSEQSVGNIQSMSDDE
jgi:hypothetical protein